MQDYICVFDSRSTMILSKMIDSKPRICNKNNTKLKPNTSSFSRLTVWMNDSEFITKMLNSFKYRSVHAFPQ